PVFGAIPKRRHSSRPITSRRYRQQHKLLAQRHSGNLPPRHPEHLLSEVQHAGWVLPMSSHTRYPCLAHKQTSACRWREEFGKANDFRLSTMWIGLGIGGLPFQRGWLVSELNL